MAADGPHAGTWEGGEDSERSESGSKGRVKQMLQWEVKWALCFWRPGPNLAGCCPAALSSP